MQHEERRIQLIGVSRGNQFSPNHINDDAAILMKTAEKLGKKGCEVKLFSETEFVQRRIQAEFIFNMARDHATIPYLKELEETGSLVINSGQGIENCIRQPMTEILMHYGIPHPKSYIIPTDQGFTLDLFPCWIKRGDSHAMVKEDVVYVECRGEANIVLADFRNRGIPRAVVNEHLIGDLVKFYGVKNTDFFYSFYPTEQSHSKYGLEAINGKARGFPFCLDKLKNYANRAAEVLQVPVYGGDCVVGPTGEIRIIDFNDWPSFAPCCEEASTEIAGYIYNCIIAKQNSH